MNVLILMGMMAVAALFGAFGQFFLKKGSDALVLSIPGLLSNWWFYGFVFVYATAVIINIVAYRLGGKVSVLYPVISLSYAFTALIAWKLLGERLSTATWVGTAVIMVGISIIGWGQLNG